MQKNTLVLEASVGFSFFYPYITKLFIGFDWIGLDRILILNNINLAIILNDVYDL
jgi:hypothetical protein